MILLYWYELYYKNTYETEKEANILLKKINDYAYSLRDDFLWFDDPLEKTLIKAKSKEASKPILLIDHSDNCASGELKIR